MKRLTLVQLETSINRNIVECKDDKISIFGRNIRVLIETLWNVKIIAKTASYFIILY